MPLQHPLPQKLNTLPLAIMTIPLALTSLFSMKIAKILGHVAIIRISSIAQFLALLIAPSMPNYELFLVFYLAINCLAFSLVGYPAMSCVWSYYVRSEGKVTGIVLSAFGVANFVYVLLITGLVNPHNAKAMLDVVL
jgi:hypothetical protein